MTVISRPRNNYGFLFGDGADGDVTISANTNLTSTLNGDIVYRNYMNLTINSGCTLSVSKMCKGLWIRVRGTLTLNGAISMSNKGCYIAGGGDDLYLCYSDIKVPAVGAAGGAPNTADRGVGNAGVAGTDGKCGGGGAGGTTKIVNGYIAYGGSGAAGGIFGGGCGAGGGAIASLENNNRANGEAGQAYGLRGGNGAHAQDYYSPDSVNGEGGGGAGGVTGGLKGGGLATDGSVGSGGILVVMANQIVGSGQLLAKGANGGIGQAGGSEGRSSFGAGGGGGSGGGSITLFYYSIISGTLVFNASGGLGGAGSSGGAGGAGGAGSCRDYSLAELLSHTRI